MSGLNYEKVFNTLVEKTANYVTKSNLHAMILGISGGIDSTVCAAICHEVSKKTGIPLIGRSLPTTFNKKEEITSADLVGNAFCDDYKEVSISKLCWTFAEVLIGYEKSAQTNLANGNIQARLRMIYLYNLASIHKGLVIDTDNLTEHNLGYWTIHGDVGDFNPIGGLWKTEVFELAEWIMNWYGSYTHTYFYTDSPEMIEYKQGNLYKARAIRESLKLKPTAGLGITNNDLEEIGAESYDQVDAILQEILAWKTFNRDNNITYANKKDEKEAFLNEQQMLTYPIEIISAIASRHFSSEFKRAKLPVVIERISYLI
jgi:NAD+ synthetase